MTFLKLFFYFLLCLFCSLRGFVFTDEDTFSKETKPNPEITIARVENKEVSKIAENSNQISKEDITILSEDFKLSEDTIIQNKKSCFG